jgi:peroxiredoxin
MAGRGFVLKEEVMPIDVGRVAPAFTLPSASEEGTVSLSDYRGKQPVLLAIFRGLYCPFCRQHIARLGVTAEKLQVGGVETLGIVATPAARARLYFRFRHARFPIAADPDLTTHRAYGLPCTAMTPEIYRTANDAAAAYARAQGIPVTLDSAYADLDAIDGYQASKEDAADVERHQAQFIGQFLVDCEGVVRWVNVEHAVGEFPTEADLMTAVRGM